MLLTHLAITDFKNIENPTGSYAGIPYKVGDVIFQGEEIGRAHV